MVQQQKLSTSQSDWEKRRQIWDELLRWEEGLRRREEKRHLKEELRNKEEQRNEEQRKRNEELTRKKEEEAQCRKDKERREDRERQRQYMQRVEALRTAQQMQLIEAEDRLQKHLEALSGGTSTGSSSQSSVTGVAANFPQTNLINHLQSPSGPTPEQSGASTPTEPQVRYPPDGGRPHAKETSGCHCSIM